MSTLDSPDYVEYLESGKLGVFGKRTDTDEPIHYVGRTEGAVDYWDGE